MDFLRGLIECMYRWAGVVVDATPEGIGLLCFVKCKNDTYSYMIQELMV